MARAAHNDVLDALLDEIATSTGLSVCSSEPSTRAEALNGTTHMLASVALTAGAGSGDFAAIADDGASRMLQVLQQSDISITSTGTANHIALYDGSDLLFVTTCTAQALTSGGTVTVPAFDINVEDPVAP